MKKIIIITAIALAAVLAVALVGELLTKSTDPLTQNGDEASKEGPMKDGQWLDHYGRDDIHSIEYKRTVEDFPDLTFIWNTNSVLADDGSIKENIIMGSPVWNVFFFDITGDGTDEICATVSAGNNEEIAADRIIIHDRTKKIGYEVSDPGSYNFRLEYSDGKLTAKRVDANNENNFTNGHIVFEDGCMRFKPDGGLDESGS